MLWEVHPNMDHQYFKYDYVGRMNASVTYKSTFVTVRKIEARLLQSPLGYGCPGSDVIPLLPLR